MKKGLTLPPGPWSASPRGYKLKALALCGRAVAFFYSFLFTRVNGERCEDDGEGKKEAHGRTPEKGGKAAQAARKALTHSPVNQ